MREISEFSISKLSHSRGFTLIELVVVMGAIAMLFGLVSINLITVQNKASLNTTMNTLTSDLRTQQLKAMVGDTDGNSSVSQYGVHFDSNSYSLFYGSVYKESDSGNFIVELPSDLEFETITFPQSQIVFDIGTGEVVDFVSSQNTFSLTNTSSQDVKTFELNRYGTLIRKD